MTSKQEAIISGEQIKNMLLGAYKSFEKNYQYINDLNVFPVPDGDTGTNMMHTMAAVAKWGLWQPAVRSWGRAVIPA